jgi:transcriptional regulator with XRE-family HTH domain
MNPNEKQQLGKFLREIRTDRAMSLRTLADASGLDWSYIGRLEKGEISSPDPVKLQKLARALEVEIEDFYALAGYSAPEGLPTLAPYLRAKYDLPEEASGDVERYIARLVRRYEKAATKTQDSQKPRRKP